MADIKHKLKKYKYYLSSDPDSDKIALVFNKLSILPVTISLLQDTGIGKVVNSFRKTDGEIGQKAKDLVSKWKSLVTEEVVLADLSNSGETTVYANNREAVVDDEVVEDGDQSDRLEQEDVNFNNSAAADRQFPDVSGYDNKPHEITEPPRNKESDKNSSTKKRSDHSSCDLQRSTSSSDKRHSSSDKHSSKSSSSQSSHEKHSSKKSSSSSTDKNKTTKSSSSQPSHDKHSSAKSSSSSDKHSSSKSSSSRSSNDKNSSSKSSSSRSSHERNAEKSSSNKSDKRASPFGDKNGDSSVKQSSSTKSTKEKHSPSQHSSNKSLSIKTKYEHDETHVKDQVKHGIHSSRSSSRELDSNVSNDSTNRNSSKLPNDDKTSEHSSSHNISKQSSSHKSGHHDKSDKSSTLGHREESDKISKHSSSNSEVKKSSSHASGHHDKSDKSSSLGHREESDKIPKHSSPNSEVNKSSSGHREKGDKTSKHSSSSVKSTHHENSDKTSKHSSSSTQKLEQSDAKTTKLSGNSESHKKLSTKTEPSHPDSYKSHSSKHPGAESNKVLQKDDDDKNKKHSSGSSSHKSSRQDRERTSKQTVSSLQKSDDGKTSASVKPKDSKTKEKHHKGTSGDSLDRSATKSSKDDSSKTSILHDEEMYSSIPSSDEEDSVTNSSKMLTKPQRVEENVFDLFSLDAGEKVSKSTSKIPSSGKDSGSHKYSKHKHSEGSEQREKSKHRSKHDRHIEKSDTKDRTSEFHNFHEETELDLFSVPQLSGTDAANVERSSRDKKCKTNEHKSSQKKHKSSKDDNEMSFDDFLSYDMKSSNKKLKVPSKHVDTLGTLHDKYKVTKKAPTETKMDNSCLPIKEGNSCSSSQGESKGTSMKRPGDNFMVPVPTKQMKITENDILCYLPETQAHYRPWRFNQIEDDKTDKDFDLLSFAKKANPRTQVYSGKRQICTEMKSLFDICMSVLTDNIDNIDTVGGIPFDILKPVLEKATPVQLYSLEDNNPHFLEDTDYLWEQHSKRDFRTSQRDEMETWRELYLRKFDEREAKFERLKGKMAATVNKQAKQVKKVQLAYVDTVAKPPRDVLRQQKLFGTASVSKSRKPPSSGSSWSRSKLPSQLFDSPERPQKSMKNVAPMMQKTMKMIKKIRR